MLSIQFIRVHICKNLDSGKIHVAKIFKPKGNEELRKRHMAIAQNEAEILSLLHHPSIASIQSYNLVDGKLIAKVGTQVKIKECKYIITDYYPNQSLLKYVLMPHPRFPESIVKHILLDIINTMKFLATKGICHRDLKPENILLAENFRIILIDFGFAKKGSLMSSYKGTEVYMAPEILNMSDFHVKMDSPVYSGQKADIFSIGVIIFMLCVGVFPFNKACFFCDYKYKRFCLN